MKRTIPVCVLLTGLLLVPATRGQEDKPKAEDPAHAKLRELRDRLVTSFNKQDLDGLLKDVHENVVVTWQNGEVSRGHKGIREYYNKMMTGPAKVVVAATASGAEADDLTMLSPDGQHGLAWGKLDEHFKLTDGKEFDLANRWTAALVRDGDNWKVVGLHVSANVFDNSVQALIVKTMVTYAVIGGVVGGLLVGSLLTVILMRRRAA